MKRNRLLGVVFTLSVFMPFSVNAEEFKNGDTKYFIEKVNLKCEINDTIIDLDDTSKYEFGGIDKEGNFVYANKIKEPDEISTEIYVLNTEGCTKYDIDDETGLNYALSIINTPKHQYVLVEENKVYIDNEYEYYESFTKIGDPNKIDLNKSNYCQYNEITKNEVCGLPGTMIDKTKEFTEIIYLTILPSTNVDSNLNYYKWNDKESKYDEVSAEEVRNAIKDSPINVINYYTERNENKEYIMTIENKKVLELLNNRYAVIYDYDIKNKIAYFIYQTSDTNYGYIDSNGKDYGKELEPYHYSNDLVWALSYGNNKNEYVITDKSGNILYTLKDIYFEYDDESSEPIYELNNLYKPFHEIKYENYVYDLYINGISKDNIYRVYEYKLLSEDNQKLDGSSNYIAKFSGIADRVKNIKVDTEKLEVDAYVTSGSTIVTLDTNYLKTLSNGNHTLTVEYEDGVVLTTQFNLNREVEKKYKVTFDANGGIFKDSNKTLTFEDWQYTDYENLETPTREGYKFSGYYTEKEGGTSFDKYYNEAGVDKDMTLYARWEEQSSSAPKEEEPPQTFDDIRTSIFMGIISLIGLVGSTIYLKKRNKVRA